MAIDYFSKWVETKALASTMKFQVIKFLKARVISRYKIPHVLVSDNNPQFMSKDIKRFLEELHIEHNFAYIKHAQTNGLVKAANKVMMEGLKKKKS